MAEVIAVPVRPTVTGAEPTYTQVPANTDTLEVPPGAVVHVRNASASPTTVGYALATVDGLTVTPPAGVVVAAGANRLFPAPERPPYVHASTGKVRMTFSATAPTVTYAVVA
jgi:hypothetical protein